MTMFNNWMSLLRWMVLPYSKDKEFNCVEFVVKGHHFYVHKYQRLSPEELCLIRFCEMDWDINRSVWIHADEKEMNRLVRRINNGQYDELKKVGSYTLWKKQGFKEI